MRMLGYLLRRLCVDWNRISMFTFRYRVYVSCMLAQNVFGIITRAAPLNSNLTWCYWNYRVHEQPTTLHAQHIVFKKQSVLARCVWVANSLCCNRISSTAHIFTAELIYSWENKRKYGVESILKRLYSANSLELTHRFFFKLVIELSAHNKHVHRVEFFSRMNVKYSKPSTTINVHISMN